MERTGGGWKPWRLDVGDHKFIHPDLKLPASHTSGVRIELVTDSRACDLSFDLITVMGDDADAKFDVFVNGESFAREVFSVGNGCLLLIEDLPDGENEVLIYLPTNTEIVLRGLAVCESARVERTSEQPRWITHGSSITHCRLADGPGYSWPTIVARKKRWNAWNLGFGGQCKFDSIVARTISRMPADRISLCLGINTALGFYSLRTWEPAVEGFIMTVRDGHPTTPLLVISPILSPPRESFDEPPTTIGLKTMRASLEAIVGKFRDAGDSNITYLDGTKIIGPGDEATMPDQLHPDAEGIKLMAERFLGCMPKPWSG